VRLILDTNTVLSALLWRGTPYRLLEVIRKQYPTLQLYSSPVLLQERTGCYRTTHVLTALHCNRQDHARGAGRLYRDR
jgi:predicted nucleic acid-binding protein